MNIELSCNPLIHRHYAGDVIYSINGFIEKNRDTLFQDFKRLLFNSKDAIVSGMWPEGSQDISKTTKRPLTAGTLFQKSMTDLVATLLRKGLTMNIQSATVISVFFY